MRKWPEVKMRGIIWHWTAGTYTPSALDLSHYHFVIDGQGHYHDGVAIELNANPIRPGYAAHTLHCNTGFIGVSCASMAGAVENSTNGNFPLRERQVDTLITLSAALCQFYDISPSEKTTLSHAEVQNNLGIRQRGKWDIAVFPFNPSFNTAKKCGDYIRAEVKRAIAVHSGV